MTYSDSHREMNERSTSCEAGAPSRRPVDDTRTGDVQLKCSLCGKRYWRSASEVVPFCSRRCQQIDLGNWLDERYGFPVEGSEDALPDDAEPGGGA